MSRLLLPRTLAAIWTDRGQDGTVDREGVAVLALDTTEDQYLLIARDGNSYWAPITNVQIIDDTILAAANRGQQMAESLERESTGVAA